MSAEDTTPAASLAVLEAVGAPRNGVAWARPEGAGNTAPASDPPSRLHREGDAMKATHTAYVRPPRCLAPDDSNPTRYCTADKGHETIMYEGVSIQPQHSWPVYASGLIEQPSKRGTLVLDASGRTWKRQNTLWVNVAEVSEGRWPWGTVQSLYGPLRFPEQPCRYCKRPARVEDICDSCHDDAEWTTHG